MIFGVAALDVPNQRIYKVQGCIEIGSSNPIKIRSRVEVEALGEFQVLRDAGEVLVCGRHLC